MFFSFFFCILYMAFLEFLFAFTLFWIFPSGIQSSEFLYPNFTASSFQFIDSAGSFLFSRNGTFKASMFNPGAQQINFYLCIIHVASNIIIWSANRDAPVSCSGKMTLTTGGIKITDDDGSFKWSTPQLKSSVSALQLTEAGNLVLLDHSNGTLWESFNFPTDTVVIGQALPMGALLTSSVSDIDLSKGDYTLVLTASDAILKWHSQTYWRLSTDTNAYTISNYAVEYMAINGTGLYLIGHNNSAVIIQVTLSPANFRLAKLDDSGQFVVSSFSGSSQNQEFGGPADECQIPFICGRLGFCVDDAASDTPLCSCPSNFHIRSQNTSDCVPSDDSYSLPVSCNGTDKSGELNSSSVSYLMLGYGMNYFSNRFSLPAKYGVNLSICQELCSSDCSCLGIFYGNSSCNYYMLENVLGSVMLSSSDSDQLGCIKTLVGASPSNIGNNNASNNQSGGFPIAALVLLPFTGFFLALAVAFICWQRPRISKFGTVKSGLQGSPTSEELDAFPIPGLPVRFEYHEIAVATDNFMTKIGAGGFGAVYKGTLPDKTLVAVKKISNLGVQGQKDFCTEIAIIGNVHHVNLVKLKGFCAQGQERLLVYEYMNRGSLDRSLFGNGPVLKWKERHDIALGTARGLAYLHNGCEQKIIHCDVKPENILLHDHFLEKISDFGLSKLLSPEQSSHFTTMRGTRGYLAPEWLTRSAISDKTDVYSFGMVLLEIVSGRKNSSVRTQSHSDDTSGGYSSSSSAVELAYFPLCALEMHEQGRYLELADPRLEGRVTSEEVEKLVRVALCCVHEDPALRPNMVTVVGMLEDEIPLSHPRIECLNFLRFYGRRFSEASTLADTFEQNETMLYPEANTTNARTKSGSNASVSYISAQQISEPR